MINSVYSTDNFIHAEGPSSLPYVNAGLPSAGMLRLNGSSLQVYDGSSWLSINSHVSLGLSDNGREIMEWARNKMQEERRLQERMKQYPALQDAYDKFCFIDALTLKEEQNEMV